MHGVHVLDYVLGASQASRKVFFPPENLQTKHNEKKKPGACCGWITREMLRVLNLVPD